MTSETGGAGRSDPGSSGVDPLFISEGPGYFRGATLCLVRLPRRHRPPPPFGRRASASAPASGPPPLGTRRCSPGTGGRLSRRRLGCVPARAGEAARTGAFRAQGLPSPPIARPSRAVWPDGAPPLKGRARCTSAPADPDAVRTRARPARRCPERFQGIVRYPKEAPRTHWKTSRTPKSTPAAKDSPVGRRRRRDVPTAWASPQQQPTCHGRAHARSPPPPAHRAAIHGGGGHLKSGAAALPR